MKKIALITGASRGIGAAILQKLSVDFFVIGTATTESGAEKIAELIKSTNAEGAGKVLDFSKDNAAENLIQNVQKKYGEVAVLINNAGLTRDNLAMRMNDADWDAVLNANLKGAFQLCRLVMRPMMKARWGRIINIASVVGVLGNAGQANYCASKAGLIGLTKALARELGSRNITVNAVAPGFIQTDMTHALTEEQQKEMLKNIPLARAGTPDDVANAVYFLATEAASYITGNTLHINGGMLMA